MQVHLTEVEYYYFESGALSIAHTSPPPPVIETVQIINCINIKKEEIIQEIGEGRILIQKK